MRCLFPLVFRNFKYEEKFGKTFCFIWSLNLVFCVESLVMCVNFDVKVFLEEILPLYDVYMCSALGPTSSNLLEDTCFLLLAFSFHAWQPSSPTWKQYVWLCDNREGFCLAIICCFSIMENIISPSILHRQPSQSFSSKFGISSIDLSKIR